MPDAQAKARSALERQLALLKSPASRVLDAGPLALASASGLGVLAQVLGAWESGLAATEEVLRLVAWTSEGHVITGGAFDAELALLASPVWRAHVDERGGEALDLLAVTDFLSFLYEAALEGAFGEEGVDVVRIEAQHAEMPLISWRSATRNGALRSENADGIVVHPDAALFGVIDGCGSRAAARTAASALDVEVPAIRPMAWTPPDGALTRAARRAHADLRALSERGEKGAGAELSCLHVRPAELHLLWAGNCRAYLRGPTEDDDVTVLSAPRWTSAAAPEVLGSDAFRVNERVLPLALPSRIVLVTDGFHRGHEDFGGSGLSRALRDALFSSSLGSLVDSFLAASGEDDDVSILAIDLGARPSP
jgi:hypothetical protein